jgi:hypothetical protein
METVVSSESGFDPARRLERGRQLRSVEDFDGDDLATRGIHSDRSNTEAGGEQPAAMSFSYP